MNANVQKAMEYLISLLLKEDWRLVLTQDGEHLTLMTTVAEDLLTRMSDERYMKVGCYDTHGIWQAFVEFEIYEGEIDITDYSQSIRPVIMDFRTFVKGLST